MSSGLAQEVYWRADVGYSWAADADIRDKNFTADGVICGDAACNTPGELDDVGDSAALQVGAGWRFNANLRADLTLGYRGWYELDDGDRFAPPNQFSADITSWAFMANYYWDFTVPWQVKPYVGGGVGVASNEVDDVRGTTPLAPGLTATAPGDTVSDVAWAVMAGASVPINPGLAFDVGYRYIDLGDAESGSGVLSCAPVACPGLTYSGASGDLASHELMIGLRF